MDYQLRTHPRAKKITLRLDKNGQPIVTVPHFTPKILVNKFVAKNQGWIDKHRQQLTAGKDKFNSDKQLMIFGRSYQKEITIDSNQPSKVLIGKNKVLINLHSDNTDQNQVVEKFLKNTAIHYLTTKTNQLAKKMKVKFSKLSFRAQTTRWGSCSSKGALSFNWKLVHFPPEVIDYVIIHELAHLEHLNHSADFWQLVAKFCPEHKLHQGWLKRQGIGVH